MAESYTVLWSKDRCRMIKRAKDAGPLEVVFGGEHTSMPPISKVKPGDDINVVTVSDSALYILAHMAVEKIVDPEQFVLARLGITRDRTQLWDSYSTQVFKENKTVGHRIPWTCADQAALGNGSEIRLDHRVPAEIVLRLRLGSKPGKEQPLTGIDENGAFINNLSLHGHTRRLSEESAQLLAGLLAGPYGLPAL